MIHLTRSLMRRWLSALLHIQDTPERTAAAFALGVFFGFSPFLGLHTIMAIAPGVPAESEPDRRAARRLLEPPVDHRRLLRVDDHARLPPILRTRLPPGFRDRLGDLFELSILQSGFWRELARLLAPLLWPFTVGSTLGAVVLATAAYPLALAFIKSRKHLQEIIHHKPQS